MLLNEKATKTAIRYALKVWLRRKVRSVGKEAKVVVYFSGHGYAQSGTSYWLPHDARVKDAQSIEDTGISSDHVNSWLSVRSLGSRSVVVLVDACHSGFAWSGTRTLQKTLRKKLSKGFKSGVGGVGFGEGHAVIASSMQDQYSVEAEELRHGVFSYALMEGLRGKADFNRDGKVTLPELWAYLSYRVKALAQKYKRYPQVPVKSGPEAGEMVLSFPKVAVGVQGSATGAASGGGEGVLLLSANVGGVEVHVDGAYKAYLRVAGASKRLRLKSGRHEVVLKKRGYGDKRVVVDLESGGELPLEGFLVQEAQAAVVERPTVSSAVVERPAARPMVAAAQSTQGSTQSPGTRKTFGAKGVEFAMRWIPAGSFMMGSPSREAGREEHEGPQRRVRISKGFWMLESEVTQGQWKALMGENPSRFKDCGENCPVENVNWEEARGFADKLSEAVGLSACRARDKGIFQCVGWRLPTEGEWEYAAQAEYIIQGVTRTAYHTGDCISTDEANYNGNYPQEDCPKGMYRQKTIGVCSLARNKWGLCDMHGNVWEWTMDVYGSYAGMPTVDPLRTSGSTKRVVRGGGWFNSANGVRAAHRDFYVPTYRYRSIGFRLIRY
jgi:formylglycine-generating enzyme required for sulfatase activity